MSSIADYFRRDPVSLCQGIAKVEKRMREEDGFREKLMGLEKNLVEGRKIKITKSDPISLHQTFQQAAQCIPPISRSEGSSPVHLAMACGHRGRK